ncbi:hypothetical protein SAMN05216327_121100 [Dyadobacter sp. SG02]|uniref:hypothetical protein n=1 Tax=Dyadobacter sp. SG02 TaxID=1855291 RepID=UPI0008C66469|nr:hypothetical protein [Dyadobacter sp. SG02]SEJ81737.1 hypothetical protein SAMN05216327_121100 [Dyadobacter sp. SG02]
MKVRTLRVAFITIFAGACGHDKECVPPPLADQIIGNWNAELVSEHSTPQEITFEKNGDFKESRGLLFGTYLKSEDYWKVENDSLYVEGELSNGTQVKYQFSIMSRSCNEILFDLEGADTLKLIKK